tara:strand:+ start:1266 stop:1586 length:321 start_codon:yes stop_codon:yes gene_type:complete
MKKKEFPNNWRAIQQSPDEFFPSMPVNQFMDWKIHGYMIPDSVSCMIRETHENGKVTEHTYNTVGRGQNKVRKLIQENKEFILCTMEGMWHLKPDQSQENHEPKNI